MAVNRARGHRGVHGASAPIPASVLEQWREEWRRPRLGVLDVSAVSPRRIGDDEEDDGGLLRQFRSPDSDSE